MAISVFVLPPELASSAKALQAALVDFNASTTASTNACQAVLSNWNGSASEAFASQEAISQVYYQQMGALVSQYVTALSNAQRSYITTDVECAQLLQAVK